MARKRIAVLVASIDREYQQDFASGLVSAGVQNDVDICIFNSQGHMNVAISTSSEVGESMIYDLPDLEEFDGVISMAATMGNDVASRKVAEVLEPVRKSGKPHVSIDVPQEGAVCILFDDAISIGELTEHLINEHGAKAVEDNLEGWLKETSSMGSGDDITMLIAYLSSDKTSDSTLMAGVEGEVM